MTNWAILPLDAAASAGDVDDVEDSALVVAVAAAEAASCVELGVVFFLQWIFIGEGSRPVSLCVRLYARRDPRACARAERRSKSTTTTTRGIDEKKSAIV